jgi:hypothetical protein
MERYMKNGKAIHRAALEEEKDYTIVMAYQLEFRGIANYYRLAYNMHHLNKLKWIMETSLTKTLATKHKMSVSKVYEQRLLADFCELCGSDKDVEVHHVRAMRKLHEIKEQRKRSMTQY